VIHKLSANLLLKHDDAAFLELLGGPGLHNVWGTALLLALPIVVTGCSTSISRVFILMLSVTFVNRIIIGTAGFVC
jgi:hypothetical protein